MLWGQVKKQTAGWLFRVVLIHPPAFRDMLPSLAGAFWVWASSLESTFKAKAGMAKQRALRKNNKSRRRGGGGQRKGRGGDRGEKPNGVPIAARGVWRINSWLRLNCVCLFLCCSSGTTGRSNSGALCRERPQPAAPTRIHWYKLLVAASDAASWTDCFHFPFCGRQTFRLLALIVPAVLFNPSRILFRFLLVCCCFGFFVLFCFFLFVFVF